MTHPLDNPQIIQSLFYPRKARMNAALPEYAYDAQISTTDDEVIGCRLYRYQPDAPLMLFFHGNGEVASDYDMLAPFYFRAGVSLLVVDYRGYGWSSGSPLTTKILPDALAVLDGLAAVFAGGGVAADVPLFIMGRSLGSAPAVHLAYTHPEMFKALILDSPFADTPSLFKRLSIQLPAGTLTDMDLPLNNTAKVAATHIPLLVIHGAEDQLLPPEHGQALYDASPSNHKQQLLIAGGGHNNLLMVGRDQYLEGLTAFIQSTLKA